MTTTKKLESEASLQGWHDAYHGREYDHGTVKLVYRTKKHQDEYKLGHDDGTAARQNESLDEAKKSTLPYDMNDETCLKCKKGHYGETSIHDDIDGVLHCDKCNHKVKRHNREQNKNKSALNLIEAIAEGDTLTSAQLFNEALRSRIDEKVAAKKKEVAAKISGDNSKAFDKIVKSKHKYVLTAAAKHPNIPHHHLNTLGNHDDPHVQHAALQNPKFGADPSKEEKEDKAHDKFQKELITHIKSFKGKS